MRPRHADTLKLKEMGFTGAGEDFRIALTEIEAESFPQFTIDESTFTRDEAGTYCAPVRKRLN